MSDTQQLPLSVQPVISYPREAQVGKTYLMTIDLQPSGDGEWLYEEEEYPIYCMLETSPLFSSKPLGEPAVVLHRFGGSYGAAKFLLTAAQEEMEGEIRVTLVNGWGVPVQVLNLNDVKVRHEIGQPLRSLETLEINSSRIISEFDLRRYQEGLRERYGNLNLDSLDASAYDYREKLRSWQIFLAQNVRECQEFLPQVYEIPKEYQKHLRESNQLEAAVNPQEWERYKQVYYQQPVRSVLDIVNDSQNYPYIVILGDPGSGKSMLLQYIALNWARTPLNIAIELPIPLLIELRSYSRDRNSGQCKDFLEFFHKGSVICRLNQHQLHEQLKAGKVSAMFDGLDEVFDPVQREEVITDIHRFTNDYPNVRVIVTSRIIGYKPQRLQDAQFRHFILQDLESDQIQDFLYRWHELTVTDETDKVRKRERLQQAIKTSSAIGELARNPLLLTMMAILNRHQELPRDRPELYNQASRVLLHQWDVEQKLLENPRVDSVVIDYKDKQAMLRKVAYHIQAADKADKGLASNLIRGDDLEKILTNYLKSIEVSQARTVARLLVEQLRSRNFILCYLGAHSYAFMHRAFLEYFCACEFVERFGKRGLEGGLTLEELKMEVFGKHWQDESWHEVMRLIVGMIEPRYAGEIIDYLIEQNSENRKFTNLFLASTCLSEVRNRNVIAATGNRLLTYLKNLTKCYKRYETEEYDYDEGIVRTVSGEISELCKQALLAILNTWKDDPNTATWLREVIQSDNWVVRSDAVKALARNFREDSETLLLLKTIAQSSDKPSLRIIALQEIARVWKDEPNLFEFLCDRAVNDPFYREDDRQINPRQTALEAIIEQYPNTHKTLQFLKNRAESDPDERVRKFATEKFESFFGNYTSFWKPVYQLFKPEEPLIRAEELKDFYVKRTNSPLENLMTLLETENTPAKFLLAGHRGSGQTTELRRLKQELASSYTIIWIDTETALDRYNIGYAEIVLLIGQEICYKAIQPQWWTKQDTNLFKNLEDSLKTVIYQDKKNEVDDLKLPEVLTRMSLTLKGGLTREVTKNLNIRPSLSEIIAKVNAIIQAVEKDRDQKLLVIVDGLARHDQATALEMFSSSLLTELQCHIIYSIPIALRYSPTFRQPMENFQKCLDLMNLPVFECDQNLSPTTKPNHFGREILSNVIKKRLGSLGDGYKELFNPDALELICEKSGGMMRNLVRLARTACEVALRKKLINVDLEVAKEAVQQIHREYVLSDYHYPELDIVHRTGRLTTKTHSLPAKGEFVICDQLLQNQFVLSYYDNQHNLWFDVNPILLEDLERWKVANK